MDQPAELAADHLRGWARPTVVVPVFVLVAAMGGILPSFPLGANLLAVATGGALFWLGLASRVPQRPGPRKLSGHAVWWLLPVLCLAAMELVNFALGSTYIHPTLSKLADPALTRYSVRATLYFGWLTAFWVLVRR